MHLPQLDPNFVLWCNVAADLVTSIAASAAAALSLKLWLHKLGEIRDRLEGKK